MWNKLFGSITYFIFSLPLIALETVLSLFLFIDKLIQGEFFEAFKTLMWSPFKAIATFFNLSALAFSVGWDCEFTELFKFSVEGIQRFFKDATEIEPSLFFSVMYDEFVDVFEGGHGMTVINHQMLICEYQNTAEIKYYSKTQMNYKGTEGDAWTVSSDNMVSKCRGNHPLDCPFSVG